MGRKGKKKPVTAPSASSGVERKRSGSVSWDSPTAKKAKRPAPATDSSDRPPRSILKRPKDTASSQLKPAPPPTKPPAKKESKQSHPVLKPQNATPAADPAHQLPKGKKKKNKKKKKAAVEVAAPKRDETITLDDTAEEVEELAEAEEEKELPTPLAHVSKALEKETKEPAKTSTPLAAVPDQGPKKGTFKSPVEEWEAGVGSAVESVAVPLSLLLGDESLVDGAPPTELLGPDECLQVLGPRVEALVELVRRPPPGSVVLRLAKLVSIAEALLGTQLPSGLAPKDYLPGLHGFGGGLTAALAQTAGLGGAAQLAPLVGRLSRLVEWAREQTPPAAFLASRAAAYEGLAELTASLGPLSQLRPQRLVPFALEDADLARESVPEPEVVDSVLVRPSGKKSKRVKRREQASAQPKALSEAAAAEVADKVRAATAALRLVQAVARATGGPLRSKEAPEDSLWYPAAQRSVCRLALLQAPGTLLSGQPRLRLQLLKALGAFCCGQSNGVAQPLALAAPVFGRASGDPDLEVAEFARTFAAVVSGLLRPQVALTTAPPYDAFADELAEARKLHKAKATELKDPPAPPVAETRPDSSSKPPKVVTETTREAAEEGEAVEEGEALGKSYHRVESMETVDSGTGETLRRTIHDVWIGDETGEDSLLSHDEPADQLVSSTVLDHKAAADQDMEETPSQSFLGLTGADSAPRLHNDPDEAKPAAAESELGVPDSAASAVTGLTVDQMFADFIPNP